MSVAAILGAGPIGATVAQRLMERSRFRAITLIDAHADGAAGKALDLRQASPIARVDIDISGNGDQLSAIGADVIIVADAIASGEWQGDPALELVRRLLRAGATGPIVFAGPGQIAVMETARREASAPADRMIATAGSAAVHAARALAGLEMDLSGADVNVTVAGRPPAVVIAWSTATVNGSLITGRVPAHRLIAVSSAVARLWPPGPQAIAAATAPIAEALVFGSRRLHQAVVLLEDEFGIRGVAGMMPVELGRGRVIRRLMPSLSPQERTDVMNTFPK